MKLIKVTSAADNKAIYINVTQIGHMYEVEAKYNYGRLEEDKHTRMGITTHNNGGLKVKESMKQILKMMEEEAK
jgi:hypothetical protein